MGMRVLEPFGRGNRVSEGSCWPWGRGCRKTHQAHPVRGGPGARYHRAGNSPGPVDAGAIFLHVFTMPSAPSCPPLCGTAIREMWSLTGEPLPEDLSERERRLPPAAGRPHGAGRPVRRPGGDRGRVLSALKKRGLLQMEPQGSRKVQDRVVQIACLALEPEEALERMERKKKSAARQYDAVAFLAKYGDAVVQELCYYTGVSRQGISSLERAGLVSLRSQEEYRITRRDMTRRRRRSPSTMSSSGPMTSPGPDPQGRPGVTLCRGSPAAARPWCISAWPRHCWPRAVP